MVVTIRMTMTMSHLGFDCDDDDEEDGEDLAHSHDKIISLHDQFLQDNL